MVKSTFDKVEELKLLLSSAACGGSKNVESYGELRRELLSDPSLAHELPRFVRNCRSVGDFWEFIKSNVETPEGYGIWASRRLYLNEQFEPLLSRLEAEELGTPGLVISDSIDAWDYDQVSALLQKAQARVDSDPEGAITAARSLVESVIKHIMAEAEIDVASHDLPAMYKRLSKELNLAPDQHSEAVFKQILGGCASIVNGLSSVRNSVGDAHGHGPLAAKPSPRHARFVVTLAGSFSGFLIETWQNIQARRAQDAHAVKEAG